MTQICLDKIGGSNSTPYELRDEDNNDISDLYNNYLSVLINDKQYTSKQLLRWLEIRSWVHFNNPNMINEDNTDWGLNYSNEPLLGFTSSDKNLLFEWAKKIKPMWKKGFVVESFLFPNQQYRIIELLYQGNSVSSLYQDTDGGNNYSTGYISENLTKNEDGEAGKVLYISFRETTGPLQLIHWVSGMISSENVDTYSGNQMLKGVSMSRGIWSGPYSSGDKTNKTKSIRNTIVNFIEENRNKYTKIIISGLSLGGALAQCAALDVSIRVPKGTVNVILYGSPRVGTSKFLNIMNETRTLVTRIEADKLDNIVGFPCSHGYIGPAWKHAGVHIRINVDTNELIQNGYDQSTSNIIKTPCITYVGGDIFKHKLPYRPILAIIFLLSAIFFLSAIFLSLAPPKLLYILSPILLLTVILLSALFLSPVLLSSILLSSILLLSIFLSPVLLSSIFLISIVISTILLLTIGNTMNFHTRSNYFKYLYYNTQK